MRYETRLLQQDGESISWGRVLAQELDQRLSAAGCDSCGRVGVVLASRAESRAAFVLSPRALFAETAFTAALDEAALRAANGIGCGNGE